jgi:hypothetical protein
MNILYICNEYPPGKSGGIGSATRNLAMEMVRKDHRVFVAGLYMPGYGEEDFQEADGVMIWRKRLNIDIGLIRNDYSLFDTVMLRSLKASGLLARSFRKGMREFISFLHKLVIEHEIDIIEWPDFNECFQYTDVNILPLALPAPVIVKLHGSHAYIKAQTGQPVGQRIYHSEKNISMELTQSLQ